MMIERKENDILYHNRKKEHINHDRASNNRYDNDSLLDPNPIQKKFVTTEIVVVFEAVKLMFFMLLSQKQEQAKMY